MNENEKAEKEILDKLSPEEREQVLSIVNNIERQQALTKKDTKKLPVAKHKKVLRKKSKAQRKSRRNRR